MIKVLLAIILMVLPMMILMAVASGEAFWTAVKVSVLGVLGTALALGLYLGWIELVFKIVGLKGLEK